MGKAIELKKGEKISRLTCSGELKRVNGRRWYRFICDCGNEKYAQAKEVVSGKISSCGCYKSESIRKRCYKGRDKQRGNGTYTSWANMISRCKNKSTPNYQRYGGRGITVCQRWLDFDLFIKDMGEKPSKRHSIGRIDNDGVYEPANCRWETDLQQANNKSNNRFIDVNGEKMTVSQAARERGVNPDTVYERLNRGMSVEDALIDKNYNNVFVVVDGEPEILESAKGKLKIPTSTYYKRINEGLTPQEVINLYLS